jgi:preprotein translocase subunit SecE
MSLEIIKKGQGRYVRWTAYLMGAALVAFGAIRLYATINVPYDPAKAGAVESFFHVGGVPLLGDISVYKLIAVVVGLFGLLALHLFLNREKAVDLLIDTEQELRKVSWPSRREVQNATVVVVLVTMTLALLLAGFDTVLEFAFQLVYGT